MPISPPNAGETRQEYMSRMMGDKKMMSEFPNQSQRAAVLENQYDRRSAIAQSHAAKACDKKK